VTTSTKASLVVVLTGAHGYLWGHHQEQEKQQGNLGNKE